MSTLTIGWTKSDMANGYSSFDGYRHGARQHTETIEIETGDLNDRAVCEAVFAATNIPGIGDTVAQDIQRAIAATGYRGQGAHYSFSVGDTVTIDGRMYACEPVGFVLVQQPVEDEWPRAAADSIRSLIDPMSGRIDNTPDYLR